MKRISLAFLAVGGAALFCSGGASAQTIPGQVAKGDPGWSCTTYRLVPGQQWVCGQWSFLGDRKLAPPPGFSEQKITPARKARPQPRKSRKRPRR